MFTELGPDFIMIENLILSALFGTGILIVFYITYSKISIGRSFAFTLILLPPVSCMVAMIISNDFYIAVGMVGALSIIRYRHSMKDAKNLMFVFWAVSAGLACGFTQRRIAVVSFMIIALIALAVYFITERRRTGMLVVRTCGSAEDIEEILKELSISYNVRYKSLDEACDILFEIKSKFRRRKQIDSTVCERLMLLDEVSSVKFIENN